MRRRSGFGWLELAAGILLIILGIGIFVDPGQALTGLAFLYGIAAVIMGIADIVLYIRMEKFTGFGPIVSLLSGILSVMAGIMLVAYPRAGSLVLTILLPIWFIAHCVSQLSHLNRIRFLSGKKLYYFTLVVNVIGLVLGILMILPPFALADLQYLAAVYLILLGIDNIVVALSRLGMR